MSHVIYGTGKFYSLDIKQYIVKGLKIKSHKSIVYFLENTMSNWAFILIVLDFFYFLFFFLEFLDSKDPSLAFAVYGASQLNIFPIAVLDVTPAASNKEELLLCFNGKL